MKWLYIYYGHCKENHEYDFDWKCDLIGFTFGKNYVEFTLFNFYFGIGSAK